MRNNILIDIDHVLSNSFPRDEMIGVYSWDEYHASSINDKPLMDMVAIINDLRSKPAMLAGETEGSFNIVAITARPAKWRQLTMQWFARHDIKIDEILMREDEDYRPSPPMKVALALARFPDIKNEVAALFEDRTDVCNAFRELGVTVFQVYSRRD